MLDLLDHRETAVAVTEVEGWMGRLADLTRLPTQTNPASAVAGKTANATRIDQLAVLERMKGACAAAQARLSADLLNDRC